MQIINNAALSEEAKKDAVNKLVAMTDLAEKEANAEMLLEAKGFTNVVVSINEPLKRRIAQTRTRWWRFCKQRESYRCKCDC